MEERILQELQEIKKELQDIRSTLEPKKVEVFVDSEKLKTVLNNTFDEIGANFIHAERNSGEGGLKA